MPSSLPVAKSKAAARRLGLFLWNINPFCGSDPGTMLALLSFIEKGVFPYAGESFRETVLPGRDSMEQRIRTLRSSSVGLVLEIVKGTAAKGRVPE